MIRKTRYKTSTCRMCDRPGWKHEVPYVLLTEEEQRKLFGLGFEHSSRKDGVCILNPKFGKVPEDAERCDVRGSAHIWDCVVEGIAIAKKMKKPVAFEHNQRNVVVTADSDPEKVYRQWWQDVYHETPEESAARR